MKIAYTVYYTDGSSGITEIEKPAGAHPDSHFAMLEGIQQAEFTDKTVDKIGRSVVGFGTISDANLVHRNDTIKFR